MACGALKVLNLALTASRIFFASGSLVAVFDWADALTKVRTEIKRVKIFFSN
jgi:hypothetical protein